MFIIFINMRVDGTGFWLLITIASYCAKSEKTGQDCLQACGPDGVCTCVKPPKASGSGRSGNSSLCDFGYGLLQGRRLAQEDVVLVENLGSSHDCFIYASIFDGHLGSTAAKFASNFVLENLKKELNAPRMSFLDMEKFVVSNLLAADKAFLRIAHEHHLKDGSTATIAVLHNGSLTIANIGDSRGILVRRPGRIVEAHDDADAAAGESSPPLLEVVPLTVDHRPDQPAERQRIEEAGGQIVNTRGAWRVQGNLAISRALGNAPLRPFIIAEPDSRSLLVGGRYV